jgi:hypothetical protein
MVRQSIIVLFLVVVLATMTACGGGGEVGDTSTDVSGAAQKGPFLQGSTVLVNILDNSGNASDLTIVSQTSDSLGNFNFTTHHKGPVQIVTAGYYFNEVTGALSDGPLTLRGIFNVTANGDQTAYVNILTHLINNRVLSLVADNKHLSVDEAIFQAQNELLTALVPLASSDPITDFASLSLYDIEGTDTAHNGYLLAISATFCQAAIDLANANSSSVTSELTLLLNRFANDLAQDGAVDAALVNDQLLPALIKLDAAAISQNLADYSGLVLSVTLSTPDISTYIDPDPAPNPTPRQDVSFTLQAGLTLTAGEFPSSIIIEDLNGDGHGDIVVANHNSSYVSVFINIGDGTYDSAANYTTGLGNKAVTAGDFDGDGHLDLAVVYTTSNLIVPDPGFVAVLLGNGDGTFDAAAHYGVEVTPSDVKTGDLNGDGKLDLVAANYTSGTVSVLLNSGDASFTTPVHYSVSTINPKELAIVDLNRDGALDIAMATNMVVVMLNEGSGTFGTPTTYMYPSAPPYAMASGDFNDDKDVDLVVADPTADTASVFFGNGDGTLFTAGSYDTGLFPFDIAAGDLNNDTIIDIITTNRSDSTFSVFAGVGDGSFLPAVNFDTEYLTPRCVAIGDLNNDGKPDLAIGSYTSSNISVFLNTLAD